MKGFRSRVSFGHILGSILRIRRIMDGTPIFMGLLLFMSLKSFYIFESSNDRFLNFLVKIRMLLT